MKVRSKSLFLFAGTALLSISLLSGCGKKNDTANQNGNQSTNTNGNAGSGSGQQMPGMPGSNAANNQPAGPAIKSTTLAQFLPQLSGYEMKSPEHVDMNMNGMVWSSAKSEYTNGDSHVTITIFDYNHNTGLSAAYSMYTAGNLNIETDDEITRSQQIGGSPGWVNWKKKQNSGSVGVIVNDRIWVVVEANKASSLDDLVAIAQKIDLSGLGKAS